MADKKPWEEDVFGVEKKKKSPMPRMSRVKKPKLPPPPNPSKLYEKFARRNKELVKKYGEKKSSKARQ